MSNNWLHRVDRGRQRRNKGEREVRKERKIEKREGFILSMAVRVIQNNVTFPEGLEGVRVPLFDQMLAMTLKPHKVVKLFYSRHYLLLNSELACFRATCWWCEP